MSVTIEWLGHCAYRLTRSDGLRILIDPFDDTLGYKVPDFSCDFLVISHYHYDTSAIRLVPKPYELVDKFGTTLADDVVFNAFPMAHDNRHGRDYGHVNIFHFELDGLKIAFLSHIGEYPKSWVLERLGNLDICFMPTGGQFTLGPRDARFLVREMKPRYVIPIHFNTRYLNFTLLPISEFTKVMEEKVEVQDWRFTVDKDDLPQVPTVVLMQFWPGVDP